MNTNASRPCVLIAGRNSSSILCMARSVGRAGYPVEVLQVFVSKPKSYNLMRFLQPEAHSQYVKAVHTCICNHQISVLADKLLALAKPGEKMLLIPTCDLTAAAADSYMERLRAHYLLPHAQNKPGQISRLMRKELQTTLAKQAGLPVLNSCVIRTHNGAFDIPDSVRYPCFLKPNVSKDGVKSSMCRCNDPEELRAALGRLSKTKDVEMLVEDFVEIHREYALLGLSTSAGAVCPGFFVQEQGGHEGSRGVTMVGRILPCNLQQELIDAAAGFVHGLQYEGLFDVDLIETTDGKWYFVELNLRYGASGYAVTESGVNLPAMYADYMAFGKPIDLHCRVEQPGKQFVSEKVLLDEFARGFVTVARAKQITKEADIHFIWDGEDKKPYRHFRKFYLFGAVTRIWFSLKRIRRRSIH